MALSLLIGTKFCKSLQVILKQYLLIFLINWLFRRWSGLVERFKTFASDDSLHRWGFKFCPAKEVLKVLEREAELRTDCNRSTAKEVEPIIPKGKFAYCYLSGIIYYFRCFSAWFAQKNRRYWKKLPWFSIFFIFKSKKFDNLVKLCVEIFSSKLKINLSGRLFLQNFYSNFEIFNLNYQKEQKKFLAFVVFWFAWNKYQNEKFSIDIFQFYLNLFTNIWIKSFSHLSWGKCIH